MDSGDLQRQVDDLVAQLANLTDRADASEDRADNSEARANASQHRADVADSRADLAQKRAESAEDRVDLIEADVAVDRRLITELQAKGTLSQQHAAQLEQALHSSRSIGTAIGILMASRGIGAEEALAVLKGASQRSNTKLSDLASTIVAGADALG